MKFCEKCGSLMLPKKERKKSILKCSCGHKIDAEGGLKVTEKQVQEKSKSFEVIDSEKENLPTCEEKCESCGNETAYYWIKQTRSADEPPTRFLKCTKCKATRREYD